MTEHYRGKRIDELLSEIARLNDLLETFDFSTYGVEEQQKLTHAQMLLAVNKAKLTALQGE
jgi:hypothetical protein